MPSFFSSEETQVTSSLPLTPLGDATPAEPVIRPQPRGSVFIEPQGQKAFPRRRTRQKARTCVLAILAYVLGGFAPILMRQGRRTALWASITAYTFVVCAATLWCWTDVHIWLESGRLPLLPWLLAVLITVLLGMTAWSRAIVLAGEDARFDPASLPGYLRHPITIGGLGLLAPGSGLLASGHPRRAAVAFWGVGPLVLSALVLWRAGWLWECNQASGGQGLPPVALEVVFIASALVAFIAVLGWFGGALDGVRMSVNHLDRDGRASGDWLAIGLLTALAIFFLSLGPSSLARNLDRVANGMLHEDYRMIPLCMELGAMRLDPSQPRYAMQTAEIYEMMGKDEKAQRMRDELRARWEMYAEMLLRGEVRADKSLRPLPLEPEGKLLPSRGSLNRANR